MNPAIKLSGWLLVLVEVYLSVFIEKWVEKRISMTGSYLEALLLDGLEAPWEFGSPGWPPSVSSNFRLILFPAWGDCAPFWIARSLYNLSDLWKKFTLVMLTAYKTSLYQTYPSPWFVPGKGRLWTWDYFQGQMPASFSLIDPFTEIEKEAQKIP